MRQAELQIADDVGVLDVLVPVGPVEDSRVVGVVLLAGRLAHVVTGREELVVLVGDGPERMPGECGPLPDEATGLSEQGRAGVVEDLVGDGLLRDFVYFVGVDDIPGAVGFVAVVSRRFEGGPERRLLAVEAVSVVVLRRANGVLRCHGIALDDRIVNAVHFWVNSQREDVLVVLGVDPGSDLGAVWSGFLGGMHAVGVKHASEFDFKLVSSIQGEGVVEAIFVVGSGDDLRDDELAVAGGHHGSITVVGMLVEKTVVLLVDADSILDNSRLTLSGRQHSVHVMDGTLAIAAQFQRVRHETGAVFTDVKGVLLVMRRIGAAIRDNHLGHTDAVKQSTITVLVGVVHPDVGDHNTLTVVEANVHFISSPRELIASHLERHALRLGDINGLQPVVHVAVANEFGKVVVFGQGHGGPLAIHIANVDT